MKVPFGLALLLLAVAPLRASDPAPAGGGPTAEELAQFELLKRRRMEQRGISLAEAGLVVTPVPIGAPPQKSFAEQERENTTEFNRQFGSGAYEGITGFSERCKSADGCNKLATANFIMGAQQFVSLRRDVEQKKVAPESDAYRSRHMEIKGGIGSTMREFRPRRGAGPEYAADFIKFSDPIVKKVFTPEELLRFARRNAVASDAAPFYTYLGDTLNAAGPPSQAKAAFDAALDRDPRSDAALSGRAEARLNMGDYPGAVQDSRAALKINPGSGRALATLKFSEGRQAPGASGGSADVGGAGVMGVPGGSGAPGGALAPAVGPGGSADTDRPGAAVPFDAMRRSDALVADARRSLGLGDAGAAAALLGKAVELNPSSAEALSLSAITNIRLKDYPAALAAAEAGLALAPNNVALLDAKANALNFIKDYRGALAAADLAIAANPRDAMAHYNRAWALGGLREREGSIAALRAAAELNAQFAPALESALSLPLDSDIVFLFPGEKSGALAGAAGHAAESAPPPWRTIAGLAGALLAGLTGVALMVRASGRRRRA